MHVRTPVNAATLWGTRRAYIITVSTLHSNTIFKCRHARITVVKLAVDSCHAKIRKSIAAIQVAVDWFVDDASECELALPSTVSFESWSVVDRHIVMFACSFISQQLGYKIRLFSIKKFLCWKRLYTKPYGRTRYKTAAPNSLSALEVWLLSEYQRRTSF